MPDHEVRQPSELQPFLDLVKEEYRTLRDESKQATINMLAAIQVGASVIGALMYAGFSQWNTSPSVVLFVFFLIVPVLGAVSIFIWVGEAIRMKRVGDYLCIVEQKASFALQKANAFPFTEQDWLPIQRRVETALDIKTWHPQTDPLCWEQWLRESRAKGLRALFGEAVGHQTLIYMIRLGLFPGLIGASWLIARLYAKQPPLPIPDNVRAWLDVIRWASNAIVLLTASLTVLFAVQLGTAQGRIPARTSEAGDTLRSK
jgi:hypothetical protein